MTFVRYNTDPFNTLQQQINMLFDQYEEAPLQMEHLTQGAYTPPLDLKEDAEAYHIIMEVPGVSRDKIDISMQDDVLTIKGNKEKQSRSNRRRDERIYGKFTRMVALPRAVDSGNVTAKLQDGILNIALPKEERVRPRRIQINNEAG